MPGTRNLPRALSLQPRLPVASIAASCRFYRDALGFDCAQAEPSDSDGFAIVDRGGFGIQLVMASPDRASGPVTLWMQVDDAAVEYERVRGLAPVEWGPEVYWYGCREFSVRDPDGHHVIFSSQTDEAPTCVKDES